MTRFAFYGRVSTEDQQDPEASRNWQTARARALIERRLKLQLRVHALHSAERIFQRWIVLHRPLASIMYILSAVHVVLSFMYGMAFAPQ